MLKRNLCHGPRVLLINILGRNGNVDHGGLYLGMAAGASRRITRYFGPYEIYLLLSVARRFLNCSRDVTARTWQAVGSIRASGLELRCARRCQRFEASGWGVIRMSHGVVSRNEK